MGCLMLGSVHNWCSATKVLSLSIVFVGYSIVCRKPFKNAFIAFEQYHYIPVPYFCTLIIMLILVHKMYIHILNVVLHELKPLMWIISM